MSKKEFSIYIFILFMFIDVLAQPISYNMTMESNTTGFPGTNLNDIWGYTRNGQEFAIVGSSTAINFFNVTDCSNPSLEAQIVDGNTVVWRDFKTFGDYAYGVCDGSACDRGLEIFSLIDYTWSRTTAFFSRAHNIFIENGRLYVAGSNTINNGIIIVDISTDPQNPALLANMSLPDGYIHDIFVRNDTAYVSHGYNGYTIYDFTDLSDTSNPGLFIIGSILETNGYNHSSWVHPRDHYAFVAEEVPLGKPMYVYDLADPANPKIEHTFKNPLELIATNNVPHNPFVVDDILYISHYHDGVQVYDVTDPLDPIRIGFYDTYLQNNGSGYSGYNGAWGVYPFLPSGCILVSDIQNGFFTFTLDSHPLMTYINEGDLLLEEAGAGVIISRRDDEKIRLSIDNSGQLVNQQVTGNYDSDVELDKSQITFNSGSSLILTTPDGSARYKVSVIGKSIVTSIVTVLPDKLIRIVTGNLVLSRKGSGLIFKNPAGVCLKLRWNKNNTPEYFTYTCPVE